MNRFAILNVISITFLLFLTVNLHASEYNSAGASFVSGQVLFKLHRDAQWRILKQGDVLSERSSVRLPRGGRGLAEIQLSDKSVIRLRAPAEVIIGKLSRKEGLTVKLHLLFGHIWAKVRKVTQRRSFEIWTKTAVLGVRGTSYDSFVNKDESVDVRVFEGSVAASNNDVDLNKRHEKTRSLATHEVAGPKEVSLSDWLIVLESMQRLHIDKSGVPSKPVKMNLSEESESDWFTWNLERDKAWDKQYGLSE